MYDTSKMMAPLSRSTQRYSCYFPMQVDLSFDLSDRFIFAKHGGWTNLTFLITLRSNETTLSINCLVQTINHSSRTTHTHSQFSSDVVDSLLNVLLRFFRVLFHEDGPDHLVDSGALIKAIKHLECNSAHASYTAWYGRLVGHQPLVV